MLTVLPKPGDRVKLSLKCKQEECRSGKIIKRIHTRTFANKIGVVQRIHYRHMIYVIWNNTDMANQNIFDKNAELLYNCEELDLVDG